MPNKKKPIKRSFIVYELYLILVFIQVVMFFVSLIYSLPWYIICLPIFLIWVTTVIYLEVV